MAALDNLVFRNYTLNDKQHTLNARLFNGAIGFSVFPRERLPGANKPLLSIQLDQAGQGYLGLLKLIDMVTKGPLGTKVPMSKTDFNRQTNTRSTAWTISLEKDSDMCYWITLTDAKTNASFRFAFKASSSFTIGNEPPSKADMSSLGLNMFGSWLKQAQKYAPMTANKPMAKGQGGFQRGGGAPAAVPAAGSGDPDDLPF